ncbi:MAG: hypothetical protein H6607_05200 [Flavobacteriales bacterium]|nr:hypothetical protein [Flavobacteriales bacterium]
MNKWIYLFVAVALWSCTDSKEKLAEKIAALETGEVQNAETKKELNALYEQYALKYPDDSASQFYTENAAMYAFLTNDLDRALKLSENSLNRYKNKDIMPVIAKIYGLQGKSDSCLAVFENYAKLDGKKLEFADARIYVDNLTKVLKSKKDEEISKFVSEKAAFVESQVGVEPLIPLFEMVYNTYPKNEFSPLAMARHAEFLSEIGNVEQATAMFQKLIATYPDTQLAKDAQIMIDNNMIGKTAEEQMQIIMKKKGV